MHLNRRGMIVVVVTLAVAWLQMLPAYAASGDLPATHEFLNLQEIIERGKNTVFPALIFVKPIIEDFDRGERRQQQVFGSGVIISPDGIAVTNHHVVDKAIQVHCVLSDKRQVSAEVLGKDPETDLALLQLDMEGSESPLPYAEFADSDAVTEGDFVMALGSPFGFTRSISLGIVSNTERYLGFETEHKHNNWLQTDAAINPGNSGGPLVDTDGRIVGINARGIFLADNVGFAIPSNIVKAIAEKIREDGEVRRAWCGTELQPLRDFYTNTFTDAETGVLISDVEANSPADAAGIEKGDILLSLDGAALDGTYAEDLPAIERAIAELAVDEPIAAKVLRDGKEITCTVTPRLKGKLEGDTFECKRWNMTLKEINKHENPELHFYRNTGIYVYGVRRPGNASEAGLKKMDIITTLDRREAASLADVETIYGELVGDEGREKRVLVEVLRGGYRKWITLEYVKDYEKEE